MEDWKSSWVAFSTQMSQWLSDGKNAAEISEIVSGERIIWEGVFKERRIDELCSSISLAVCEQVWFGIDIPMDLVGFKIREDTRRQWLNIPIGSKVSIDAEFGQALGADVGQHFNFRRMISGRTVAYFSLIDAIPVKVQAKKRTKNQTKTRREKHTESWGPEIEYVIYKKNGISQHDVTRLIEAHPCLKPIPDRSGRNPFTGEEIHFSGTAKAYYLENDEVVGNCSLERKKIVTTGIPREQCETFAAFLSAKVKDVGDTQL